MNVSTYSLRMVSSRANLASDPKKLVYYRVACHPGGEHVIVAGRQRETNHLHVAIYSEDGECLRTVGLGERTTSLIAGIAVSMEGRIAAALQYDGEGKIVVF